MKREMTYNVFIDDQLRPIDIFYKTNNPFYKVEQFITVKSFNEFKECVEEHFKKDGSYPGFISFDFLLTQVLMKVTDDYSVYQNDDSYVLSGFECAQWIIDFVLKNNIPIPKYIIHDTNPTGRYKINKVFNNPTSVKSIDPFITVDPVIDPAGTSHPKGLKTEVVIETKKTELKISKTEMVAETKPEPKETVKIDVSESKIKTDHLQLEYWSALKKFMESNKSEVKIKKTNPQYFLNFPLGKSEFNVSAQVSSKDKELKITVNFWTEKSKINFEKVKKIAYNDSLKFDGLYWDKNEGHILSFVTITTKGDFTDKNDWKNQFNWFMKNLNGLISFFKPIIKNNEF